MRSITRLHNVTRVSQCAEIFGPRVPGLYGPARRSRTSTAAASDEPPSGRRPIRSGEKRQVFSRDKWIPVGLKDTRCYKTFSSEWCDGRRTGPECRSVDRNEWDEWDD